MSGKRQVIILLVSFLFVIGFLVTWSSTTEDVTAPKIPPSISQSSEDKSTQTPELAAPDDQVKTYPVKVYFSKHPASDDDPGAVFPVSRVSDTIAVAKFSLTELFKGPTPQETAEGYFSTAKLRAGTSSCNGQDFSILIKNDTATLTLCKPFDHLGVVADGQAKSTIEATLKQFTSVKKVIILNSNGDCEFDLSGMNLCKQ